MKFSAKVKEWADKAERRGTDVVRAVALQMDREVVLKTPVDTGRARANWAVELNGLPENYNLKSGTRTGTRVGDRTPALGEARQVIRRAKAGDTIYIVNGLPYIRVLEYGEYPSPPKRGSRVKGRYVVKSQGGYSRQAPQGMVRITVERFQEIVGATVQEVLRGDR